LRSYIFTASEREAIFGFLEGRVNTSNAVFRRLVIRMREFKRLSEDVDLYLRLKDALAKSKPAVST